MGTDRSKIKIEWYYYAGTLKHTIFSFSGFSNKIILPCNSHLQQTGVREVKIPPLAYTMIASMRENET